MRNHPFLKLVANIETPRGYDIYAAYLDIAELTELENITLADFGPKIYMERSKKLMGSNYKLISNKPIILKDGTGAYRTEFEFLWSTGGWNCAAIVVSVLRDKKFVALSIMALAGNQSEVAWVAESLTFE